MKLFQSIVAKIATVLAALLFISCSQAKLPYQDTSLSFEERTEDLLSRLSLEQKAALLISNSPAIDTFGIPAYNWWNECLHGVARAGRATSFPQAIGMAAMWDDAQMFEVATAISDEARAKHHDFLSKGKRDIYMGLTFWTPNINIFRDPRWGRGMETYGEDPYLTGELAVDFIKGLQGDDPKYLKLVATSKHFAVHSGPEKTRHSFDVWPSKYDLEDTYLPHFRKSVMEGGVYSVMCAYQRLEGAPCCGSKFLEGSLRNNWGFEGYIVSDCGAIDDFYGPAPRFHNVVQTPEEAAAMAIKAGTDVECGSVYKAIVGAVEKGLVTEAEVDVCVRRAIMARMRLGMFDPEEMVPFSKIPYTVVESPEHQKLALETARKSMVLLKNEKNTLPFSKEVKKVAVIGPNSNDEEVLLANYFGFPSQPKTPLQGLKEKLPNAEVVFAQGSPLAKGLPYFEVLPAEYLFTDASKATKGLNAEYFANKQWKGEPVKKQIDSKIDFVWGTTSPLSELKPDSFSIRWTGVFVPPTDGTYALGARAFSGCRMWVNDSLIVRGFNDHEPIKDYEYFTMKGGQAYSLKIEYAQRATEHSLMQLLWEKENPNLKQQAIDLAKQSDVVVLCMGLSPHLEGEEMKVKVDGFEAGDRLDIKLPAVQTDLIKAITALGKPTVLVLLNGSAVAFNWEAENVPAIVEAWYPGQAGGTALADILFGDYNPAGRLPLTFYKSIDQIPAFDNYDMAGKTYKYFAGEPLYPFGYGLSYTTFAYDWKEVPQTIEAGKELKFTAEVTNTGSMDGDEVVQLYVSLPDSKYKKPIRSLQGFKRVHLKAGEKKSVEFRLTPNQIAAFDEEVRPVVEAGKVMITVGGGQPNKSALESKQVIAATVEVTGGPYVAEHF